MDNDLNAYNGLSTVFGLRNRMADHQPFAGSHHTGLRLTIGPNGFWPILAHFGPDIFKILFALQHDIALPILAMLFESNRDLNLGILPYRSDNGRVGLIFCQSESLGSMLGQDRAKAKT